MNPSAHILLVDDDPLIREALQDFLASRAFLVTCASSGVQALDLLAGISPDVILLDIMMPKMDGFTVCRRIRQNPAWQHLPIILVTALNDKEHLIRGLMAGADEFITKPIDTNELLARVLSMLRIKRQHDELQAILQMRTDMVNMIVHDIRNPLNAIVMHSSLLAESKAPAEEMKRNAQTILNLAHRVEQFANDLLLAAKMEQGALVPELKPVDVRRLLTQYVVYLEPRLQASRLSLQLALPEQPYAVFLDEYLFTRAVDNLLSNAIKHSPVGGNIRLAARYPLQANSEEAVLTLSVIDEGPGVPDDFQEKIFGKFETAKSTGGNGRSIGLGLAFCKMVAEVHCGRISVTNNSPRGATFTLAFWLDHAEHC